MDITYTVALNTLLSPLDWSIFITIFALTAAVIAYGSYKQKTNNKAITKSHQICEYLLMGRQLTLPLFIATLTSTWYGNFLGVTQIAFEHGIYNFITQGVFWYLAYLLFALYFAKKIRRYNAVTLPELIQQIFGSKSARLSALLILFKTLPISYAISLGIIIQAFFDVSLSQGIIIGVAFVMTYTSWGGFRAVVLSDSMQCLWILIGMLSVIYFSFANFGGYEFLSTHLPKKHFTLCGNHSFTTTLAWLFIACATTFINPTFLQRCMAAKNNKVAVHGILGAIVIWIIIDICTTLGGMYARATLPNADPTNAYLMYSLQVLPNGWKGLFLASVIGSILSTLDSFLLLATSIVFYDFTCFDKCSVHLKHTIALLTTSILTIICSLCFAGKIENVWLTFKGCFSSCLLFPILWGFLFQKRITDQQFVITCITGCLGFMIWKCFNLYYPKNIEAFYIGSIITLGIIIYFFWSAHPLYISNNINRTKPA